MWDPLCSYFISHPDVEKPGKVKTIVGLLRQPLTKAWLLFLSNILAVFDKFNVFFQTSSTSTIYKLHGQSERLLKKVLSFFIQPQVLLSGSRPITEVAYMDHNCQLTHEDIFVGDNTAALLLHLQDEGEDVQGFYNSVLRFYEAFVAKQLKAFDFKSEILPSLAFLILARVRACLHQFSAKFKIVYLYVLIKQTSALNSGNLQLIRMLHLWLQRIVTHLHFGWQY